MWRLTYSWQFWCKSDFMLWVTCLQKNEFNVFLFFFFSLQGKRLLSKSQLLHYPHPPTPPPKETCCPAWDCHQQVQPLWLVVIKGKHLLCCDFFFLILQQEGKYHSSVMLYFTFCSKASSMGTGETTYQTLVQLSLRWLTNKCTVWTLTDLNFQR